MKLGHFYGELKGYREANSEWIFQVDSDNEIKPEYFHNLWNNKNKYDFLIGTRVKRHQPFSRRIVSGISMVTVKLLFGKGVYDFNSPYRLMRRSGFKDIFTIIPSITFALNVINSGMAAINRMRILEIPVSIQNRMTGEVSIRKFKLLKAAFKSWWQTIIFWFRIPRCR